MNAGRNYMEETTKFDADGNTLEGVLAYPVTGATTTAVLCLAPHPQMGGRMDNNVIRHLAQNFAGDGCLSLRFNYRGVGSSEIALPRGQGLFDHWENMEREQRYEELLPDAIAAYRTLASVSAKSTRRIVVGYSLGAVLGGMLAHHVDPTHLVAISPPTSRVSLECYRGLGQPKLFIGGDSDFAFDEKRFQSDFVSLDDPKHFAPMPGSDHFFRRQEATLYQLVRNRISP